MTGTAEWATFLAKQGGKDPGCGMIGDRCPYTCIESDAVHNACPACLRCTLKAGYKSMDDRYRQMMA